MNDKCKEAPYPWCNNAEGCDKCENNEEEMSEIDPTNPCSPHKSYNQPDFSCAVCQARKTYVSFLLSKLPKEKHCDCGDDGCHKLEAHINYNQAIKEVREMLSMELSENDSS